MIDKKKATLLTAIFMISIFAVAMVSAQTNSSAKPVYKLRIDTHDIELEGGGFDVWNYVKNPSNSFERDVTGPLHNVEVEYLTITFIQPGGVTHEYRFYPDGYWEYLTTGERSDEPQFELRWDATVHPGETALVFYSGWLFGTEYGSVPGLHQFTYELRVEYEGMTYELVKTFNINVREH